MLASLILHNITIEPFPLFTYVFLIFHAVRTVAAYLVCWSMAVCYGHWDIHC